MPATDLPFLSFKTVAFIDSNVALECLSLEQLPWREIDTVGPILILVTPTVLKEVDSKKHHQRLGDHARRFNRLIGPAVVRDEVAIVRETGPRVELRVAICSKVNWAEYPELDPEEADSRIVGEVIHCRGLNTAKAILLSHDIRPLSLARAHHLSVRHVGDNWLRPKELTQAEKKTIEYAKRIAELEDSQPKIEISAECSATEPVEVFLIADLTEDERLVIRNRISQAHPQKNQIRSPAIFLGHAEDYEYDKKYMRYINEHVPKFVASYERKLELNFGQIELIVNFANRGNVRADSLVLTISVEGGWINDRYVVASPSGPVAPQPSAMPFYQPPPIFRVPQPIGRHEVVVAVAPKRGTTAVLHCEDFRHGVEEKFACIAWLDPRQGDGLKVTVTATAANLHGEVRFTFMIAKTIRNIKLSELLDIDDLKFKASSPLVDVIKRSTNVKNLIEVEK